MLRARRGVQSVTARRVSEFPAQVENAHANRKRAIKKLFGSNAKSVEVTLANIEVFLKDTRKVKPHRSPRHHWAMEVCCLAMFEIYMKAKKKSITFEHVRENLENFLAFVEYLDVETPSAAQYLAVLTRRCMLLLSDISSKLEHYAGLRATKWRAVAETLKPWIERTYYEIPSDRSVPSIKDFTVARILGAGGFGAAYKARYGRLEPDRGVYCTVKLVSRSMFEVSKHACVDKIVGSSTRHPCLGRYFSTFLTDQAFVTVMEYIRGVDLSRAIKRQRGLREEQIRVIIGQLGLAVNHMHLKGFIHRDIKPSNMMVLPGCGLKLIDYDTIKIGIGCFTHKRLNTYYARAFTEFNDQESAGTLQYHSPEVIKCGYYGRTLDWWATGVTIYQCFFGKLPFRGEKDDSHLKEMILSSPYPMEMNHMRPSSELESLITKLLARKVQKRLCSKTFEEFLNHEFFKGTDWSELAQGHVELACEGIDSLCRANAQGVCSPLPPTKEYEESYLKLVDQKEVKQQIPLYTYVSPGFWTVLQKHRLGQPMDESDLENPPDPLPAYRGEGYRFKEFLYRPQTRRSRVANAQ